MLITIPDVLTTEQIVQARKLLNDAEWVDGRVTAGHQSARAKDNLQIPEMHPIARQVGASPATVLRDLRRSWRRGRGARRSGGRGPRRDQCDDR